MRFSPIRSIEDLASLTRRIGILPFFANRIPGWSVEENIDRAVWFTDRDGPWEWKGQLAFDKACVYGKLIRGKAAFVSPDWLADLANWRRDGYSFDARADEGLASRREILLMRYVREHPCELSRTARLGCGFTEGYDAVLTRLQMQTYIVDQDFRYSVSRDGRPYGWGNAALIAPEDWFGEEALAAPEGRSPAESFEWMLGRLRASMPDADGAALRRELR